jgi:hypothetical protein
VGAQGTASDGPAAAFRTERAEYDDQLKMTQAMADPRRTASVYFAMAEASSRIAGRPLSDGELAEAQELCRAFRQEPLTGEEQQAVERLARRTS